MVYDISQSNIGINDEEELSKGSTNALEVQYVELT
jgi:hypothetical protein